jgi:hypothetical protein
MDLYEYRWRKRTNYRLLAEKFECSRTHLVNVANGRVRPSQKFAKLIEFYTNGEITAKELLAPFDAIAEIPQEVASV